MQDLPYRECAYRHFKRRVGERYALKINREKYERLKYSLKAGYGTYLGPRSGGTQMWLLQWGDRRLHCIWDPVLGEFRTAFKID